MKLTDLINDLIEENKTTQESNKEILQGFENLEKLVETNTSDDHILALMQEEFFKSPYFSSQEFFQNIGESLINKYGLGNLINLDRVQVNQAIIEYLDKNMNTEAIVNHILKNHTQEIREAMTRRIRLESKSIINNYDFSEAVLPRLQNIFEKFMKQYDLSCYLIRGTAQLFVAQETNLAFMLEYILTREIE